MGTITDYNWRKVPEDHRHRCQDIGPKGQCINIALEGSIFCLAHGGTAAQRHKKRKDMRNYKLAKFHERANSLSDSNEIASLRDEVALLRMLIEEKINKCNDTADLLLISGPLSDLILKVEKLVSSMHRLEDKMGKHLDKTKVVQFAQVMIEIIGKYVDNPSVIDAIGEDFGKALTDLTLPDIK